MSTTRENLKQALKEHQDLDRVLRYIADLDEEINASAKTVARLEAIQFKEFEDLQKLEGASLKSVFYKVLGNKEQQLEKERQEHLQASLKYDEAKKALDLLHYERGVLEKKITDAEALEAKIELLKKKRADEMRVSNSLAGQRLNQIAKEMDRHHYIQNEIDEAMSQGAKAIDLLNSIINHLQKAKNWGQWDMRGGQRRASYNKHSYIDQAKDLAHTARQVLHRFEIELKDIYQHQNFNLNIEISSFSRFTDIFFDNLISDWVVQQKIQSSVTNVSSVRDRVSRLIGNLQADERRSKQAIVELEEEWDALVLKS